jgi:DNA-binding transcriptional regulator YiaG
MKHNIAQARAVWREGQSPRGRPMPNIAVIFRQEIIRLARKEIRRETQILRKASAQYRRLIAELKRETKKLQSDVLRFALKASSAPKVPEADSGRVRFSARSVIAQRKRLGRSAADYGKLVGVTAQTIFNWEHGTSRPRQAQINALGSVRNLSKKEALAQLEQLNAPKKRGKGRG